MIKTQVTQEPMLSVPSAIFAGLSVSVVLVVAAAILLGIILAATSLAGYHAWFLLLTNYLAVALGSLFAAKRSVGRGWLTGALVGTGYAALVLLANLAMGTGFGSGLAGLAPGLVGAVAVGLVAGMIGKNM